LYTRANGRESKLEGIVSKWFSDKGYGFVETKSGDEVFFHISQITNAEEVQRGDRVSFTLIQTKKGPKCVKIQLL
jgi:CspA family cold shock protein